MRGSPDRQETSIGGLALSGDCDRLLAREVRTGEALGRTSQVVDRPLGDDLTPLHAGPRPKID